MRFALHEKGESILIASRAYLTILDEEHDSLLALQDEFTRKRPIFPSKKRAVSSNLQTIHEGLAIVEEEIQFAEYGAHWRWDTCRLTIPLRP